MHTIRTNPRSTAVIAVIAAAFIAAHTYAGMHDNGLSFWRALARASALVGASAAIIVAISAAIVWAVDGDSKEDN